MSGYGLTGAELKHWTISCPSCLRQPDKVDSGFCRLCGARLKVVYEPAPTAVAREKLTEPGLWAYRNLLPVHPETPAVSLGEGSTPLVRSSRIGPSLGLTELHFKLESCNPTGSFKDRMASLLITRLRKRGVTTVLGITSGNAGSAVAAYGARANIRCIILYLAEAPPGKRLQMHAYGANVILLKGVSSDPDNIDHVFRSLHSVALSQAWGLAIATHAFDPLSVEAYRTIAFEILQQMNGNKPDYLYAPAGEGALLSLIFKGFVEIQALGGLGRIPRMVAVQPRGASSIGAAWERGSMHPVPVNPESEVSGVTTARSSDGDLALQALRESGGYCACPTDEETREAQFRLGREEGIFAEPAGAISLAGLIRDIKERKLPEETRAVCVVTGSGFKDRKVAEDLFLDTATSTVRFDELETIPALLDNLQ